MRCPCPFQPLIDGWRVSSSSTEANNPRLTLKEEDGLVRDQVTGQVLRRVDTANNGGSTQIGSLEELDKSRVFLRFRLDDSSHHGDGVLTVDKGLSTETFYRSSGLFQPALSDQPPR